jgi:ParB family transcriptional regulator, chromosome partitioning protein
MTPADKRRALGRGLDALLPEVAPAPVPAASGAMVACPIERIEPQPGQPRQHFEAAALDELAQSIRDQGVIEPLVVRRLPPRAGETAVGDRYEIVVGERRWRAAQRAGLREVPVVVRQMTAEQAFECALVENVQREDLNPFELAEALDRLAREFGHTQDAIAERLGKDRSSIANTLRLLKLPPGVRAMIIAGELSEGHGRALLGAADPAQVEALADRVKAGRLSVRATERLVRGQKKKGAAVEPKSASVRDVEERLTRRLGARVQLRVGKRKGQGELVIHYGTLDDLDRILDVLLG